MRDDGGLLRHPGFRTLWFGQSISFVGDQVTQLALPVTAAVVLDAAAEQMGVLTAAQRLPHLLFGLLAGVWVDRMRKKPLLVASHLGRALLLLSIPLAAWAGALRIEQLYVVGFAVASIGVVAMVANMAFLPALVGRERLIEGNGKLTVSWSVAQSGGPGLAGILVEWLTAPIAIAVDAITFVVSAVAVMTIRIDEPEPHPDVRDRGTMESIREGLSLVLRDRVLRPIVTCGACHNFCTTALTAAYVIYVTRELGVSPLWLGWVLAAGGPGALLGAALAPRLARRLGVGSSLAAAQTLTGLARVLIPLAAGGPVAIVVVLMASEFLLGVARPVFNVNGVSLRQAITPLHMQGRVNASVRFLMWSVTPLGALVGGFLGGAIGLRPTIFLAVAGIAGATLLVRRREVRELQDVPLPVATG